MTLTRPSTNSVMQTPKFDEPEPGSRSLFGQVGVILEVIKQISERMQVWIKS